MSNNIVKQAKAALYGGIAYEDVESALMPFAYKRYHCNSNPFDRPEAPWTDVYVFGSKIDRYSENIIIKSELSDGRRLITSSTGRHFPEDGYSYDGTYGHCDIIDY